MQFLVSVRHDEKEGVWYVHSSDIPGLNAEAESLDGLIEIVSDLAPDLVMSNVDMPEPGGSADISLCVQHLVTARRSAA